MAITQEKRTIMYSVRQEEGHEGEVVVHKLPFDAGDKIGMGKIKKFLDRGFTFEDPRKGGSGFGMPEVIVTDEVRVEKPVSVEDIEKDERIKGLEEQIAQLMEAVKGKVEVPLEPLPEVESELAGVHLEQPKEVPVWGYMCTKCKKVHNRKSVLGKKHMKYGG